METWTTENWEQVRQQHQTAALYVYTPLCGTCQVASRMLEVVAAMKPDLKIGKADLNYEESLALSYEIESVPCLLVQKEGQLVHKIYAFQSVPYLLEKLS